MVRLAFVVLVPAVFGLGGCTHQALGTNQFYASQTYLPLPTVCRKPSGNAEATNSCGIMNDVGLATGGADLTGHCSPGPVMQYGTSASARTALQVLPGMTVRISQTSYRSNAHSALPMLSEWRWTIPTSEQCGDGGKAVPQWQRSDYLAVRHLLSGAVHDTRTADDPPVEYFWDMLSGACNDASDACLQQKVFKPFVRGLLLDVRDLRERRPAGRVTRSEVHAEPISTEQPPVVRREDGLGRWYAGLFVTRSADSFKAEDMGKKCSVRESQQPVAADDETCMFPYAALTWSKLGQGYELPGQILRKVGELQLVVTGDPLLMFRPRAWKAPLDLSDGRMCGQSAQPCDDLGNRTAQGFVDLGITIPVTLGEAPGESISVPVGTTVRTFGRMRGAAVHAVRRSLRWLPERIVVEGKPPIAAKEVASSGRVPLVFVSSLERAPMASGVVIINGDDDVLLAPGDIIELRR